MARYVVVSFDSNELADRFVEQGVQHGVIEALIAKPTLFCPNTNAGGCATGRRVKAFTRGKKWGWWVCLVCKKPVGLRPQKLMYQVISQARNLLPDAPSEVNSVWDAGWGTFGRQPNYAVPWHSTDAGVPHVDQEDGHSSPAQ